MPALRSRSLAPIASLAVLGFAAWQGVTTLGNTPAFNRELRVEAPYGGSRPYARGAMYDTAEYLYQIAYGYENFLANSLMQGADISTFSIEGMRASLQRARELSGESLNYNPANAHAWMLLARSLRGVGESDEGLDALVIASRLAPYSSNLAYRRLLYLKGESEEVLRNPDILAAVQRDFQLLFEETPMDVEFAAATPEKILAAIGEYFAPD